MTDTVDVDATERLDRELGQPSAGAGSRAQVNLVPADVLELRRRRTIAAAALALAGLWFVAVAALVVLQFGQVDEARVERDAVQARVVALTADVDALSEFALLADTLTNREALLTAAMADELSWSGVLGDLALAFSADASLTEVQAVSTAPDAAGTVDGAPAPAVDGSGALDAGDPAAQVTFAGYSVDRLAPGVQEVIADFDDAVGFFGSYLATALDEERGDTQVTTFGGRVDVDRSALTGRYDDGLPSEVLQ